MKRHILSCCLVLSFILMSGCSKEANSKPSFNFKPATDEKVVAEVKGIKVTHEELMDGIESEVFDAEKKLFEIKFNRLKALVMEKLMESDPRKKGLTNDQYLDKYIAGKFEPSKRDVESFIKERKIPKEHVNPQLKERIKSFLKVDQKKKAVDTWLAKQTKKSPVDVFLRKPLRPTFPVVAGDAPVKGNEKAKVTIVEFSDFQCPFCARATKILDEIEKKYGNKVKVAFKQFPLPFHSQAKTAAQASLCANEQGTKYFWKFHDTMFEDQSKLGPQDLKNLAKKLGLNNKKFADCLDSKKYLAKVEAEIEEGKKLKVKSTPTFFVNGKLVNGAQPFDVFSELIDQELAKNK